MPGTLDFYYESQKFVAEMRNFITHTYALAFNIVNQDEQFLFEENQFQLGRAQENLSKLIQDNKVDSLAIEINNETKEVVQSASYAKVKQNIQSSHSTLKTQFENAEKHFLSQSFLESIKKDTRPELNYEDIISERKAPEHDWECLKCTVMNINNQTERCRVCQNIGRPRNN